MRACQRLQQFAASFVCFDTLTNAISFFAMNTTRAWFRHRPGLCRSLILLEFGCLGEKLLPNSETLSEQTLPGSQFSCRSVRRSPCDPRHGFVGHRAVKCRVHKQPCLGFSSAYSRSRRRYLAAVRRSASCTRVRRLHPCCTFGRQQQFPHSPQGCFVH